MKRNRTGTYETTSAGGETVRAFVPAPLPPVPPVAVEGEVRARLDAALLALGRLDGVSSVLPDTHVLLYTRGVLADPGLPRPRGSAAGR